MSPLLHEVPAVIKVLGMPCCCHESTCRIVMEFDTDAFGTVVQVGTVSAEAQLGTEGGCMLCLCIKPNSFLVKIFSKPH